MTLPAAAAGADRAATRYSYTGGLLTGVSTCRTGASCAGTADEVTTTVAYDANLNVTSVASGAGDGSLTATGTAAYDKVGNPVSVDGPLTGAADVTTFRYDAMRRRVGAIAPDPDGAGPLGRRAVRTAYNADGQATVTELGTVGGTSDSDWSGFVSAQQATASYDADARRTKDVLTAGGTTYGVTQYAYDGDGRPICTAARLNGAAWGSLPSSACTLGTAGSAGPDRIVRTAYDAVGRVTVVTSAYGVTGVQSDEASAAYTDNGQVLSVTDAEGNKTGYGYDGFDRLVKTSFPSPTKGSGTVSTTDYETLAYDDAGNVTSRRLRDGNSIAYSYDNLDRLTAKDLPGSDPDVSYSYDLLGRPLTAATSAQTVTLGYDALGRLTSDAQPVGTMAYQYDLAGHRTRVTWPDAFYVTYDYDAAGQMTTVKQSGSTTLASYAYDSLGRRVSLTMGNGVVTSYGYDAVSRLTSLGHDFAGTADDVTFGYGYTNAGQIASTTRSNDSYAWPDAATGTSTYASNGLNQLTVAGPASLSFDARGNTTAVGGDSYAYDSENRLTSKTSGSTTTTLGYDPLGRLTYYPASPSSPTRFLYDGGQITAAYKYPTGAPSFLSRRYVTGAGPDEVLVENPDGAAVAYMATDERGSVIARSDASGAVTGKDSYDEYGRRGSTSSFGAFGYTGQYDLTTIGVYYYKARMYSPPGGRFLQTDPIGYGDGLNWYNYVGSDPVNKVDPAGLLYNSCTGLNEKGPDVIVCGGGGGTGFGGELPSVSFSTNLSQQIDDTVVYIEGLGFMTVPTKLPKSSKDNKKPINCSDLNMNAGPVLVSINSGTITVFGGVTGGIGQFFVPSAGYSGSFWFVGGTIGGEFSLGTSEGVVKDLNSLSGFSGNLQGSIGPVSGSVGVNNRAALTNGHLGLGLGGGGSLALTGTKLSSCYSSR